MLCDVLWLKVRLFEFLRNLGGWGEDLCGGWIVEGKIQKEWVVIGGSV